MTTTEERPRPAEDRDLGERARAPRAHLRVMRGTAAAFAAAALGVAGVVASGSASGASQRRASDPALLQVVNLPKYGQVLVTSKRMTLYALSSEAGGKVTCKGACLKFWPPLLVGAAAKSVSLGPGVVGTIGFMKRSATTKQVTFDGYPLYQFVKDTRPGQTFGMGVKAFGGTWGLVRSSILLLATSSSSTSTTTTSPATTTTSGSGYGSGGSGY